MTEVPELSRSTYVVYHVLLFFAHWFGARRFDVDGDGDFDAEDVEAYFADKSVVSEYFKRPKRARQVASKSAPGAAGSAPMADIIPSSAGKSYLTSSKTDGQMEEDMIEETFLTQQLLPWFIIWECLIVFLLWLIFAIARSLATGLDPLVLYAGLDSFKVGSTDLRISDKDCNDFRHEIWRWWTYQFTHVGAMHVLMNIFLNVVLGIPLEGVHGHWRMLLMYQFGVFGGALCYFISDAHSVVVGCSGGCYALVGIHLADLAINWNQKKFRFSTLLFIFVLAAGEAISFSLSLSSEHASHAAHVGGFCAGCIIGCVVGRNLKVLACERVFIAFVAVLGVFSVSFCLGWLFGQDGGPRNIFEAAQGEPGWCWVRQVYSPNINPLRYECVRCGTQACIAKWNAFGGNISSVDLQACFAQGFYTPGR
mmetsp:Transcript_33864/g.97383  ORF Transcript_33864/g.97383 Transcript_33864/m.97383 type:complete len:423 (+) Transcript_33864:80-1348(+)